jgi:hypothetical protein
MSSLKFACSKKGEKKKDWQKKRSFVPEAGFKIRAANLPVRKIPLHNNHQWMNRRLYELSLFLTSGQLLIKKVKEERDG